MFGAIRRLLQALLDGPRFLSLCVEVLLVPRSRLKAIFELSPGLSCNCCRSGFRIKARSQEEILTESAIGDGVAHFRRASFFVPFYRWIVPKILDVAASFGRRCDEPLCDFDSVRVFEINQVLALEGWISRVKDYDTINGNNKEVDGSLLPSTFGSEFPQESYVLGKSRSFICVFLCREYKGLQGFPVHHISGRYLRVLGDGGMRGGQETGQRQHEYCGQTFHDDLLSHC